MPSSVARPPNRSNRVQGVLLALEEAEILRVAERHILHIASHTRASTVWAWGTFWITLLTAFVAAAGGLSALRSPTIALILGLSAAALGGLATAMQYGKDKNLAEQHKKAADAYRQSYDAFRARLAYMVRTNGYPEALWEEASLRLDSIQTQSPRVTHWPMAKHATKKEVELLFRQLRYSFATVEREAVGQRTTGTELPPEVSGTQLTPPSSTHEVGDASGCSPS